MLDEQFFDELESRIGVTQDHWDDENPKDLIRVACEAFYDRLCRSRPELKLQPLETKPRDLWIFWSWVKKLKADFPTAAPVTVRTKPFGKLRNKGCRVYGLTVWRKNDCLIQVERNIDVLIMVDVLWHEWAHAVVGPFQRLVHPLGKYWRAYGTIFNRYTDTKAVESTK